MSRSHFDVVVLGTDAGPIACGALLAKRGFRVLVLGQGAVGTDYELGPYRLPRRRGHRLGLGSPIVRRVLAELGITQSFRRLSCSSQRLFQVALPHHRVDIASDPARLSAEVEREFPEVQRPIEDLHASAAATASQLDELLSLDLTWPPTTLLERRSMSRALAKFALPRPTDADELLRELPEQHPFRLVTQAPAFFETGAARISPFGQLRLYDNRLNRMTRLEGGRAAWDTLLLDRIRSHSGQVRLNDRAQEIIVKRGAARGVRLFGSKEEVNATFVISGVGASQTVSLMPERHMLEELFERYGEPQPRHYRYLLNAVLPNSAIPAGMSETVYCIDDEGLSTAGEHALLIEREPLDADHSLLVIEALLPAGQVERHPGSLSRTRERVLRSAEQVLPFLRERALAIDSPHDGQPPQSRDGLELRDGRSTRRPEAMAATYTFPSSRTLGLCALPGRTPIRNLLLANAQVVPALGAEGELIAGASAARLVSVADKPKSWMRYRRWSQVEF